MKTEVELAKERIHLVGHDHYMLDEIGRLAKALVDADLEIEQLKQWVSDCQSGMYINCVYYGHRYGPREDTPVAMADVLRDHIERCPKHPLSEAKAEIERLRTPPTWLCAECLDQWQMREAADSDMSDSCPHCGAPREPGNPRWWTWECKTTEGEERSSACYEREIAQLRAELAAEREKRCPHQAAREWSEETTP